MLLFFFSFFCHGDKCYSYSRTLVQIKSSTEVVLKFETLYVNGECALHNKQLNKNNINIS